MTPGAANLKMWAVAVVGAAAAAVLAALAAGTEPAHAAFSGSNGAIAFEAGAQIYRMNSDGFGQTRLADTSGSNLNPAWSRDGKKIVFVNSVSSNPEIWWMNSDGANPSEKKLTNHTAIDTDPSFYPNYRRIAFASNRSGNFDIYAMTVNDAGQIIDGPTRMTTSARDEFLPAVSPDGKKLAYVRETASSPIRCLRADSNCDIYMMNATAPQSKTNKPVKLTRSTEHDSHPDWSPDGKKIAFDSGRVGEALEIFVMKAQPESNTNRPRNITRNAFTDWQPAFSPDGRKIAFVSGRGGDSFDEFDLFKMSVDGSDVVNLTPTGSVHEVNPSWQPDP